MTTQDAWPHIVAAAAAKTVDARFKAIDQALAATVGHKLFTALVMNWDAGESQRYYSNMPDAYKVGGAKPLTRDMPGMDLLQAGKPRYLNNYEEIKATFFDHELIRSLGCESCVNVPIHWEGRTLGMINLLHVEGWYKPEHAPLLDTFAALAVPAMKTIIERW